MSPTISVAASDATRFSSHVALPRPWVSEVLQEFTVCSPLVRDPFGRHPCRVAFDGVARNPLEPEPALPSPGCNLDKARHAPLMLAASAWSAIAISCSCPNRAGRSRFEFRIPRIPAPGASSSGRKSRPRGYHASLRSSGHQVRRSTANASRSRAIDSLLHNLAVASSDNRPRLLALDACSSIKPPRVFLNRFPPI